MEYPTSHKFWLKFLFIFLLFIFSNFTINAQNLTKKQFVEDLEFLKTELPKRHKNLYANIPEKEFNLKITKIEKKTPILNNETFEIELYKLIKEIGDEHTRIEPKYQTIFPIYFDFFKEGIFVIKTDSLNSKLLYKKLNGIEKSAIKNIINDYKKIIKDDNKSYFEVCFLNFINNPKVLKGLNITKSDSGAKFILDNQEFLISATNKENFAQTKNTQLLRLKHKDNYWYEFIDINKTMYFNYQDCTEQIGKTFETFNNELFNAIENQKPEKLIIDLRNNSGGNSAILKPFLEKLKTNYLNKKGSLYILIGKKTFSSALMNAIDLKRNYNSILIGEPTSGNVNHYGETRGFYLPNSKIIIGYSTKYWENWIGYLGPLIPDVQINYSIENFKNNKDEAIEYVNNSKKSEIEK